MNKLLVMLIVVAVSLSIADCDEDDLPKEMWECIHGVQSILTEFKQKFGNCKSKSNLEVDGEVMDCINEVNEEISKKMQEIQPKCEGLSKNEAITKEQKDRADKIMEKFMETYKADFFD